MPCDTFDLCETMNIKFLAILLILSCGLTWYLSQLNMGEAERFYTKLRTETGASQEELHEAVALFYSTNHIVAEGIADGTLPPDFAESMNSEMESAMEMVGKQNDSAVTSLLATLRILEEKDEEQAKKVVVKLIEFYSMPPLISDSIIEEVQEYSATSPAFSEYGENVAAP